MLKEETRWQVATGCWLDAVRHQTEPRAQLIRWWHTNTDCKRGCMPTWQPLNHSITVELIIT